MDTGANQRKPDAFPSTRVTWLGRRLSEGPAGLAAAREHVMRVYAEPLSIYVRGSSFRALDEPADLVHGFLASRLSRPAYLHDWADSGRPLRRWLLTGLRHYLMERARDDRRFTRPPAPPPGDAEASAPAARFNRKVALGLVREALRLAERRCRDEGFERHWAIFRAHFMDGRRYEDLPDDLRESPRRASTMARTAANRFKDALRDLVAWPGAPQDAVDREIETLMSELNR